MARLKDLISATCTLLAPVSPLRWRDYAHGLAAAPGWMPSMMLWAIVGIAFPINFGIGRQQNIPWLERFNWLTWATSSRTQRCCFQRNRNRQKLSFRQCSAQQASHG
ncbi:MAG: hypothetical protein HY290_22975 [Planctomycetia bacterium]|nr:hypothetical protein [Planctomycetia bacterium]